jgi:hypothetical protein
VQTSIEGGRSAVEVNRDEDEIIDIDAVYTAIDEGRRHLKDVVEGGKGKGGVENMLVHLLSKIHSMREAHGKGSAHGKQGCCIHSQFPSFLSRQGRQCKVRLPGLKQLQVMVEVGQVGFGTVQLGSPRHMQLYQMGRVGQADMRGVDKESIGWLSVNDKSIRFLILLHCKDSIDCHRCGGEVDHSHLLHPCE